jgi:hypothetical protein
MVGNMRRILLHSNHTGAKKEEEEEETRILSSCASRAILYAMSLFPKDT